MKAILACEQGSVAYDLVLVLAFILVFGSFYIVGTKLVDEETKEYNNLIDNPRITLTSTARDGFKFTSLVWTGAPIILLLGLSIWAWVRALERRRERRGDV